ncbi:MAG: N-6 DNA methylase, partial [Acidobacteria bacterium]|nr:N-6 DNA methylase [Acidobacteriota bacterium]
MAYDPTERAHKEWIGYAQPVGLVVSVPALLEAGAAPDRNIIPLHRAFLDALPADRSGEPVPEIADFPRFAQAVLGWEETDIAGAPGGPPLPEDLAAHLPEYHETLRPDFAVPEFDPKPDASPWLLLGQIVAAGANFDKEHEESARRWQASPQQRLERLLRGTGVPIGLLVSAQAIRLVYAPRGETSGHLTFRVAEMVQVAGRPLLAAMHMLLSAERLFSLGSEQRLPALLANSRKYQNLVSTQLAGQVLEALYELLRGFQAADDHAKGDLLRDAQGQTVYQGLLTVLLRLVFLLYAEDRGLLSSSSLFLENYSVGGLFEQLREDRAHHPDTMDQRYGGWARLLSLFRMLWRGARHGELHIPPRRGYLFDPDRFPFLEGRPDARTEQVQIPHVADGVLYRVLRKLLILKGERISYRTLDVEQIGSVYEAVMGFDLEVARGPSIAIKAKKKHGAPVTINLEALLATPGAKRKAWLKERTDQDVSGQAQKALRDAETIEDLLAALERKVARNITPAPVAKGAMVFQPSAERRRSGSHYTPRSLTSPIVEHTLAPVLAELGAQPTPEQILALKVCDPAMGSGAFLVEACRQLGAALVKAWHDHDRLPVIPPDEDELLYAQRVVAQRCLYGVDKNPMAADLAKLSLWLATLARDHPFTFLDHSLRSGDSLVGLSARQIAAMHWAPEATTYSFEQSLKDSIRRAAKSRTEILLAREDTPYALLEQKLGNADQALEPARRAGDAVVAAHFAGKKRREREEQRQKTVALHERAVGGDAQADLELWEAGLKLAVGAKGVRPFHWEIEYPEVFELDEHLYRNGGFDAIVGNPPFAGKNTLLDANAEGYLDWLKQEHPESHGNADLVAHFFRRGFDLLREGGRFGLIATNTIGQGDTRSTGLRWICTHGGTIYWARKRLKWPGEAAVMVSVVHVVKRGVQGGARRLDDRPVEKITAYLFHEG